MDPNVGNIQTASLVHSLEGSELGITWGCELRTLDRIELGSALGKALGELDGKTVGILLGCKLGTLEAKVASSKSHLVVSSEHLTGSSWEARLAKHWVS